MEGLLWLLIELLFQLLMELMVNSAVHVTSGKPANANPVLSGLGYVTIGAVFGLISLLILRKPIFSTPAMQVVALGVAVLATGCFAWVLGAWRRRRNKIVLRIDRFIYGALLGLGFGIVRYLSV